jgi:hypothetical protein
LILDLDIIKKEKKKYNHYPIHSFLKNVIIKFNNDATIEVTGERIIWLFTFEKKFVEDMDFEPEEKYTKLGYKTLLDFFKGIKKPYVKTGWYKIKKTTQYHCLMSNWNIVF